MKQQAGKKKVVLELGGNAGLIVTASASLENTVGKCVAGSFAYSGQVCIHVQRIYVQREIFNSFVEKFIEKVSKLKIGDPRLPETDMSAMIDLPNAERVQAWINEAVESGAKILYGGKRTGAVVEPTVLTNTKREMKVCSAEIFGPVVNVEVFESFEEAVRLVNDSQYGLQAGVFTDSQKEINYAFEHIEVGGVIINDVPTFRTDHMPYGGVKNSGFGREGVKYAILDMTEPKLLVKDF
jgi:glyceraldehyde-3-phosphate dehydrogenase (NADP+)